MERETRTLVCASSVLGTRGVTRDGGGRGVTEKPLPDIWCRGMG